MRKLTKLAKAAAQELRDDENCGCEHTRAFADYINSLLSKTRGFDHSRWQKVADKIDPDTRPQNELVFWVHGMAWRASLLALRRQEESPFDEEIRTRVLKLCDALEETDT